MMLEWANRWNIPPEAIAELGQLIGIEASRSVTPQHGMSEAAVQQRTRLKASEKGIRLYRNNRGVAYDNRGVPVRYGLANESPAMNKKLKSSDLVGIKPHIIKPGDVGRLVGIFMSVETKRANWIYKGKPSEVAQLAWLQLVISLGGIGMFVNDERLIDDVT